MTTEHEDPMDPADRTWIEGRAREIMAEQKGMPWQSALARATQDLLEARQPEGVVLFMPAGVREQSRVYALKLADAWDLHLRKTAGYSGHSSDVWVNFRTMEALGVPDDLGVFIRMNDKFNRLKSLAQNPDRDLVNEPIEDLLRDIAAYALIALCIREEQSNGGR